MADPSGVKATTVRKDGTRKYRSIPYGKVSRHNGSFTDTDYFGGGLTGTTIEITATDDHDNKETTTAIRQANSCGQEARQRTSTNTIYSGLYARGYGVCSGFEASIGNSIEEILGFLANPWEFVEGLIALISVLDESGLLDMFIDAMVEDLKNKQQTNNPYLEGTDYYDEYRQAWYTGQLVGFITKAVYGGQATKVVRSSTYFKTIEDAATSTKAGKAALRVKQPYDRGKARAATGLARASGKTAGPLLRQAKSAGATYRLWQLQRKGEIDTSELSAVERKRMSEYLARHGEAGANKLRWMDDEDFDALFRKACTRGAGTFERPGGGCAELNELEQDRYEDAVVESGVDPDQFDARLEQLDVNEGSAKRTFAETGEYGVQLGTELNDKALRRFVAMDNDAREVIVRAWRSEQVEVTSQTVTDVSRTLRGLDSDAKGQAIRVMDNGGKDGVWLVKNVPESRINELVDEGISLERHAEGLGIIRRSEKTVGGAEGDVGEIIAHKVISERYMGDGRELLPKGRQKDLIFEFKDGSEVEFDHIIMNSDGEVVKVFETKIGTGKAEKAEGQLKYNIALLRPESEKQIKNAPEDITSQDIKVDPFVDDEDMISIGPKGSENGYDESIYGFSSKELKELYKTTKETAGD